LGGPVPEGKVKEEERRKVLGRKLNNILKDLVPLAQRGKLTEFLTSTEVADELSGMVDDIRDVMMEYQTSLQQDLFFKTCQLIDRAECQYVRGVVNEGFRPGLPLQPAESVLEVKVSLGARTFFEHTLTINISFPHHAV